MPSQPRRPAGFRSGCTLHTARAFVQRAFSSSSRPARRFATRPTRSITTFGRTSSGPGSNSRTGSSRFPTGRGLESRWIASASRRWPSQAPRGLSNRWEAPSAEDSRDHEGRVPRARSRPRRPDRAARIDRTARAAPAHGYGQLPVRSDRSASGRARARPDARHAGSVGRELSQPPRLRRSALHRSDEVRHHSRRHRQELPRAGLPPPLLPQRPRGERRPPPHRAAPARARVRQDARRRPDRRHELVVARAGGDRDVRDSPFDAAGHACEIETSVMLASRPELVHQERAVEGARHHPHPEWGSYDFGGSSRVDVRRDVPPRRARRDRRATAARDGRERRRR